MKKTSLVNTGDISPFTTPITPSPPASAVQRVWNNQCCEFQADQLLVAAVDDVERARYLASRAPGSDDWLHTLPLSSIGLKMDNVTVRIAVGLRLGALIVRPHICVCGTEVAVNGHHWTILTSRLRTTFMPQSSQRDIVSCI